MYEYRIISNAFSRMLLPLIYAFDDEREKKSMNDACPWSKKSVFSSTSAMESSVIVLVRLTS